MLSVYINKRSRKVTETECQFKTVEVTYWYHRQKNKKQSLERKIINKETTLNRTTFSLIDNQGAGKKRYESVSLK